MASEDKMDDSDKIDDREILEASSTSVETENIIPEVTLRDVYQMCELLEGLVLSNPSLALLDIGPAVVRRNHLSLDQVKIMSGGISGYEPVFAGFVGYGMLTAAVQGKIHESPETCLIIRTMKELLRRNEHGILIIISSHYGDVINFRLAMERVDNIPNVKLKLIVVKDDELKQRYTYSCKMLLVQKIAGAMAENFSTLSEIHRYCTRIANCIINACIDPQRIYNKVLKVKDKSVLQQHIKEFMEGLLTGLTSSSEISQISKIETGIVILVNNFGNESKLDEYLVLKSILSETYGQKILQIIYGTYISTPYMPGFSITILPIKYSDTLKYLNFPCDAPYWSTVHKIPLDISVSSIYLSTILEKFETKLKEEKGPRLTSKQADILEKLLRFACNALIASEWLINEMDEKGSCVNTGTKLKIGACALLAYLKNHQPDIFWPNKLFLEASNVLERFASAYICSVHSLMFATAAKTFLPMAKDDEVNEGIWLKCLESVCESLKKYSEDCVNIEGIMLPLVAFLETYRENIEKKTVCEKLKLALIQVQDAVARTIQPKCDRPDPGAHVTGLWLRTIYDGFKHLPNS